MSRISNEVRDQVDAAIRAGANNAATARQYGVSAFYVNTRRAALGIAPCPPGTKGPRGSNAGPRQPSALLPHIERVKRLVAAGWSDSQIGDTLGFPRSTVRDFRKVQGIATANGKYVGDPTRPRAMAIPRVTPVADNPVFRNALYARVAKAIGHRLAPDIRDDAISDIILAVLSGELSEADIEGRARKLSNRTVAAWASRFGPPSLDEGRGDDRADDFNLYHLIPCAGQAEAARLAELSILAERMGVDVRAVLDTDPEPCEPWPGRRVRRRPGRHYLAQAREHDDPEYSLVGELRRPAYGSGQWLAGAV